MKYIIAIVIVILLAIGFIIIKPLMQTEDNKLKIAMFGRSTMGLWFKHWNWPYLLRIKTTYRNWPIKYNAYSFEDKYLEYKIMPGPVKKNSNEKFAAGMLQTVKNSLNEREYDAAFFKFCFVDFKVKPDEVDKRFYDLTQTIMNVYNIAKEKKIKVIFGNALPMNDSDEHVIGLQKKYNQWIEAFSNENVDILLMDLFHPLVDNEGRLKDELARGHDDTHLNDKAFDILDPQLFALFQKELN